MDDRSGSKEPPNAKQPSPATKPLTKTRLRRGDIRRDNTERQDSAEIIDFLPSAQYAVEDFLANLVPQELPFQDLEEPTPPPKR